MLPEYVQNCINQMPELNLASIVKRSVEALKVAGRGKVNLIIAGVPEKRSFFFADVNGRRRKINYSEIVYVESWQLCNVDRKNLEGDGITNR